ncbi:hypothetical protein NEF87_001715 [Candidatus Lokiarchaeum ossiferum]|uniref:Uncharacterized protein n=1 Tax=Candidatus Lokiarchaeum ossiferum TaxID=2951803 RepID=A0ABY6HPI8_9ARCH|nr:hypothetical protein NEF87_001715 [Candidatus Lokiarchaeum sp. B-35]
MKKYNLLFISTIMLLILSAIMQPTLITATSAVNADNVSTTQVSLIDTGKNDSYSRLAIITQNNALNEIWVEGSIPAEFTFTTKQNATIGTPSTVTDTRAYPYAIGYAGGSSMSSLTDPWNNVDWLHIDNIEDIPDDEASFNISVSKNVLGTISPGSSGMFQIDNPDIQMLELYLSVNKPGNYILYFDEDAISTISPILSYLVDPQGNAIGEFGGSLPTVAPSGEVARDYFIFTTEETGEFIFHFAGAKNQISFDFQMISPMNKIKFGDQYSYKDAEVTEVGPDVIQGAISEEFVHVYNLDVSAGQYLHHNFDLLWGSSGSPTIFLATPTPYGYSYNTIDTTGDDDYTFIPFDGTAYLIVINQNYYEWNAAGPIRNLLYYVTTFDEVTQFEDYSLGEQKVIKISPSPGRTFIKIEVNKSEMIHFSAEDVDGTPLFGILNGNPDLTFLYNDPKEGTKYVPALATANSHSVYMFHPGTYYAHIDHPGNSLNSVFLELTSQEFTISSSVDHTEKTVADPDQIISDLSNVEFNALDFDIESGAEMQPVIFPLSFSDFVYDLEYNITLQRSDNSNIAGKNLRFELFAGIIQKSQFNNLTFTSLAPIVDQGTITLSSVEDSINPISDVATMDSNLFLMGDMEGYFFMWPYDVELHNGSEFLPYDETDLTFRVGTSDENDFIKQETFTGAELVDTQLNDIDYTTLNYNLQGELDTTNYDKVLIFINETRMYDWWQFAFNYENAFLIGDALIYDNIWLDNSGPNTINTDVKYIGFSNHSYECGIVPSTYWILIEATPLVGDVINYNINIARYNITAFHTPIIEYDNKQTIGQFFANLPSWATYAGIGGGVLIIGVVVITVIKKKKAI